MLDLGSDGDLEVPSQSFLLEGVHIFSDGGLVTVVSLRWLDPVFNRVSSDVPIGARFQELDHLSTERFGGVAVRKAVGN